MWDGVGRWMDRIGMVLGVAVFAAFTATGFVFYDWRTGVSATIAGMALGWIVHHWFAEYWLVVLVIAALALVAASAALVRIVST